MKHELGTYRFVSLQSLADYFGNQALKARQDSNGYPPKSHIRMKCIERAVTFECVADILRNTVIGEAS